MGAILAPLAGGLASGAAASFAGKLFGGSGPQINYKPPSINAGGLSGKAGSITASPQRTDLVNNVANLYGQEGDAYGGMLPLVSPGFGALTKAAVDSINNAKSVAIGNLRDNLQRRSVMGSSFGQDALTRANAEFGQQENQARASSFLQELALTNQLTQQQYAAHRNQFQTGLDELNLEANAGTQLASQATAQLGANARMQAQLDAYAQQGAGRFFGQTLQPFGTAVTNSVNGYFGQPSAAPQPTAYPSFAMPGMLAGSGYGFYG